MPISPDGACAFATVAYDLFRAEFWARGYDVGMGKRLIRASWLEDERQAFADGLRFRAVRFQDRRKQTVKFLCRRNQRLRDDE